MKKLVVSFSGGETSAFMSQWLWNNKRDEFDMRFIFANTGQENEETLLFVERCSSHFGFPVLWVEASVHHGVRKGTGYRDVDFESASRKGEPFEEVIRKYGIPNKAYPHCTRELKLSPINAKIKSLGFSDAYTAIGIRVDEIDRMSAKANDRKIIYPLISMIPTTKPEINTFWATQPFRLNLKGYQGNCKTCWKKTDSKLYTIAKETPDAFDFFLEMDRKYGNYIPLSHGKKYRTSEEGEELPNKVTFFRNNRTTLDILSESKNFDKQIQDDSQVYVEEESCDIYAQCGIDN